jgi:hypothetical protein
MTSAVDTPSPVAAPRRPLTVRLAAALLPAMGLAGLGYAVTTLVVAPGVVDRFRAAATGADTDIDGYVTVVWIGAALGAVLAVILFALFIVLALGLRRGSQASRVAAWVVCGLGVLFGCASALTVAAQRSGDGTPGTLGAALSDAYPGPWIGVNVTLAIAQMIGYIVVAGLLAAAPGAFFGRGVPPVRPTAGGAYVTLPTYGSTTAYGPQGPSPSGYASPSSAFPSPPPTTPPAPGPDDDYWARPSS